MDRSRTRRTVRADREAAGVPGGLQLWMLQVNEPARRFYERHGFVAEQFTDGAGNEVKDARLKRYQVAAAVQPVPEKIEAMARMLRRSCHTNPNQLIWRIRWLPASAT